ncbi:N-6 DNA methylase [Geobacillus sp. 44B]|nr:N-6 DNA methylase [Geobacillus sp. 44B]
MEGFEGFEKEQEESVLTKSERELFQYLEQIYTQAIKANDINNLLFVNETRKSIQLLNIFLQKFDVVVTNPPYMGLGNMGDELREFITKNYEGYNTDLYSVFIIRSFDFLENNAYLGMVTQESFMFIQSYEKLRKYIIENSYIYKFVHLGKRAFDDIGGEVVSTAMFILKKGNLSRDKLSEFIKLDIYNSSTEKFNNLNNEQVKNLVDQSYFLSLEKYPFLYNIPLELQNAIKSYKPFGGNYGEVKKGISTGNVNLYIKYWWEINGESENHNYIPYVKGGKSEKYFADLNNVIDWRLDEMKKEKRL